MKEDLVAQFEASRPRLQSVAYRMLGSLTAAEDTVQPEQHRAETARCTARPDDWGPIAKSTLVTPAHILKNVCAKVEELP